MAADLICFHIIKASVKNKCSPLFYLILYLVSILLLQLSDFAANAFTGGFAAPSHTLFHLHIISPL